MKVIPPRNPPTKRTIQIYEYDYGVLKIRKKKVGTFANALSSLIEELKKVKKELAEKKRELKTLKKELKEKDNFISNTLATIISPKPIQYVPLTPPPQSPSTRHDPIEDSSYPKNPTPKRIITERELFEQAITYELKAKFKNIPDIGTRLIRPSELRCDDQKPDIPSPE